MTSDPVVGPPAPRSTTCDGLGCCLHGIAMHSTDSGTGVVESQQMEPLGVPWWPNLLSVAALLLSTVAIVLVMTR